MNRAAGATSADGTPTANTGPAAQPDQTAPGGGAQAAAVQAPRPSAARAKPRHYLLILSFVLWVIVPAALAGGYLYTIAKDQYASRVGFSVRTEEIGSAVELLGGITELSGSSSSDTDILFEYIQSQQMVRAINEEIPLRDVYARPGDPIFTLGEDARIEALWNYWQNMVSVFYDRGSGLIEVRVLAFEAEDAQRIASEIFDQSSQMINQLSTIARADAMRYAEEELTRSEDRLREARQQTTAFRNRTGIIDPQADIQNQMGVVNALQQRLAEALVERRQILDSNSSDPRLADIDRRVEAIRSQISSEKSQLAQSDSEAATAEGGEQSYSRLLEEFEALAADQEFAERAYLSARAARDAALAEAQRQSRYLASYVDPTLAETAEFPRRGVLLGMIFAFLLVTWTIGTMIFYSLRDRR
ncbi:capsule polysaccharide export inner-membrane protein KpsE [Roseivivax marinus]|uniref:Capsule polysaccharide export inner-membrane protein KpsE n=1 Tax=Roseivivax marinus TaxID=1379903 RepID=W4HKS3_9RHOB|nr:sugar transporter [Roseivivax marinus]ETW12731.1 capsule polysaccharide export inner-membrane protein KpsE [Roseivivax marinus]